jgi:choline dehydrogenase
VICDYAIVGAGTAGCVLAHRLSHGRAARIVVLERGGAAPRELSVPLLAREHVWPYLQQDVTEAEPGLGGRTTRLLSAKVVGGGSAVNASIYVRGRPADYDGWRAYGVHGWSFADVLPYFKKSENQARGPSAYHGVGGPVDVSDPRYIAPESGAFIDAWRELGVGQNDDFNGPSQDGAGVLQLTQRRGARAGLEAAYLTPALEHGVVLRVGAEASHVIVRHGRAVGVAYTSDGHTHRLDVEKEVIVSLGALRSPCLLLRSGIGPAAELRALGIPVVADLPGVGRNLQDHVGVSVTFERRTTQRADVLRARGPALRYKFARRGPWASNGIQAAAFVRAGQAALPNVECLLHGEERAGLVVEACLFAPESTGSVRLRSADPFDPPYFAANFLRADAEMTVLERGVEMCRDLGKTAALSRYVNGELAPGPGVHGAALRAFIAATADTCKHYVGTCRMGTDADAVVDDQLRVRGVDGLRVVDASVMPRLPAAHTGAPTIMIAEHACDLIRNAVERARA